MEHRWNHTYQNLRADGGEAPDPCRLDALSGIASQPCRAKRYNTGLGTLSETFLLDLEFVSRIGLGGVAEWSIAPVLKTGNGKPFVSSNLTASASYSSFSALPDLRSIARSR
jgi:hypothetical protein